MGVTILVAVLLTAAGCTPETNIALQKPVSQSHVVFSGYPERGIDGNVNPTFSGASCVLGTATATYPLPWWQIDLQGLYIISYVAITNRQDAFVWRLQHINIKVYNEDPTGDSAVQHDVCSEYTGPAGAGERIVLECAPHTLGRFLRIQKTSYAGDDGLQFCEAEIFGEKQMRSRYSRLPGQRLEGPSSDSTNTTVGCARLCMETIPCSGFNMDVIPEGGEGTCQLFDDLSPVPDPLWDAYVLSLI